MDQGQADDLSELVDQGRKLAVASAELVVKTAESNEQAMALSRRRDRWAVAFFTLVLLILAAVTTIGVLNLRINNDNHQIIQGIARNQQGIDELVAYLHSLPAPGTKSDVATEIISLICASSDPATVSACAQLRSG